MIRAYPLTLENVTFRRHGIVGIYALGDKIAYVHFAFSSVTPEDYAKDKCTPSYVLLDTFPKDFSDRKQASLFYYNEAILSDHDAVCSWENGRFVLNTKAYTGFNTSIAKLIEIQDTQLIEIGDSPAPTAPTYPDSRDHIFGDFVIRMASPFVMVCRSQASGQMIWKLRLTAYLYTEVEERNGILYFGTAGKGGRFYGVSLADGHILFDYNTRGTVNFLWYENHILLADSQNKPVLIDPTNGSEISHIEFGQFTLTVDQYMLIKEDRLYAAASGANAMYAVCADLPCLKA